VLRITPDETVELMQELREEGLSVKEIAKRVNVSYTTAYRYTRAKERTEEMIKEMGFLSLEDYKRCLDIKKQQRPTHKELGDLIKKRLKELGENQSWLAKQIGVSREAVSKYIQGEYIPRDKVLERLYSSLDVPYKTPYQTLVDLLEREKQKAVGD
jgi:transcriptional regulator with XRE-family HTH domain